MTTLRRMLRNKSPKTTRRSRTRARLFESLEPRMMLNSDWSNPSRPLDVNNDLLITPMDALLIINRLNSRSSGVLPTRTNCLDYYYDVNGDQLSTPMDVLQVVNELNLRSRANGSVNARVEGEAEVGPAGFISVPFTTLPGSSGQIVTVDTKLNIGREEFNEMGLFVVDGPNGAVNGVLPTSPDYAAAVFQSSQRQVLYSKVSNFRIASSAVLPAGKQVSVYVLQPASANGDAAAHLRAREISTGIMRIGWEEQPSVVPGWPTVGDRGYDDAIVDVHIGQPVNSHALPVIAAIPNQTINEQTLLSIQAITMDADLPNDSLFYSLYVAPAGATIDPNTGLIRWTPTEAQGPGNFEVVVRATDSFGAFDTESFFVAVLEVNSPPALAPIPNQQTQPGSTVSFLATAADADLPANRLTFSLGAGAPAGATIDAATGRFSWTVPAGTVASSFPITIRVTDDGKPVLSDSKPFSVNVIHVNTAPVMNTIADQTVNEEILLSVQLVATDTDLPNDLLTYSLVNGPQGATLDPQTGLFRWTPNEAQGPGRFEVVTRVTDRGGLNATKSFFVNVLEVNRAPTLAALVNANAKPGDMVTLTASATDPDLPANTMRFSLGSSAPAGSSIDPVTGAFIWNIPQTISSGNYSIPITVTDNGVPALFDTKSVVINVSSACAFDANLSGWTVFESGGTSTGRGTVIVQDCTAVIREGDSFIVGMERTITIPIEPSAITLAIKNLTFDESSQGFIRDAFEVALVDESGNTLVRSHSTGRDALFNATEGLSTSVAQGIQFSNDTITVGLGGIPAGTTGKLILRLMNDDDDKNSQVAISSVQIIPSTLVATLPGGASSKAFENSNHSATPQNSTFTGIGKLGENLFSNTSTSQVTSTTEGTGNSGKQNSTPSAIKFLTISTPFNSPIGIDHHASTDSVVVSVNYSSGTPVTFERIDSQGNHTPFSDVSGVGDEVKIATVRLGNVGGFTAGDLFSGNGVDGEILRISADGSQVDNPWISLPGSGNGLMRGSLYIDRTGVWGGDLIAVTTAGEVWRIRSDAEPTKIASVGTHLEGLVTVPDDPQRYGPLAGKIIAGAENQGLLYVIDQAGNVSTFSPGVNIEDIDIVPAGENLFGVNFGTGRVLGAPASAFREMVGDILLTQENVAGSGLYRLFWDGTALRTEQLGLASDSAPVGQWEHVTFSPAGIAELPAVPQPPLLVASAPPHSATIGKQVVLSGMAEAFGEASLGRPNFITEISVNGQNAEVIDVGGNFFHSETIQAGRNVFRVQANDAIGQQVFTELTIVGVSSTLGPINFGSFVDNTADFSSVYSRTSFNEEPKLLYVELATRNDGTFDSDVPLLIGVKNISDPSVSVIGFDGYMPDGVPYFDYSLQVEDGTLSPGEQSLSPSIVFHNPNRGQFDYELIFYGKQNSAPGITSIPDIEALAGKDYRYDVDAIDEDGDALTYSLTQAPTGMSIVPSSGVITWATSTSSIGNVPITVEVSDGRGGVARQDYTLSVIAAPPNRPPVITSAPVTQSVVLAEQGGKVVVANDEWTLSNAGFAASADTAVFAQNIASYFAGTAGRFLVYSDVFGLTESRLMETMQNAGHEWVVSTTVAFTREVVSQFDGVFVGGFAADNLVLLDYVRQGGNVYLLGGSGGRGSIGPAEIESATWELFLSEFGLSLLPTYRNSGAIPIDPRPHPIFSGVNRLFQDVGQPIVDLDPNDSLGFITSFSGGDGLYAIYDTSFAAHSSYRYDIAAFDPDNDRLTYSLIESPDGMWIDPRSGLIRWSSTADQVGNHDIKILVDDGHGGMAEQEFIVCVHGDPENHAPVIISNPIAVAYADASYQYDVDALDPDNESLTYTLVKSPSGMTIDRSSGSITWDAASVGLSVANVDVTVRVADGRGGVDEQSFAIDVTLQGTGEIRGKVYVVTLRPNDTSDLRLKRYQLH